MLVTIDLISCRYPFDIRHNIAYKMMLHRIIAAILGLLIPGWGHAYYQRYRQALLFQGLLFLIIGLICWSRWITDFSGAIALLLASLIIHIISSITAMTLTPTNLGAKRKKLIAIIFFPAFAISVILTILYLKSSLLGIDLYQIPSESMMPTLKSGDIVLVDKWAYKDKTPTIGDIVVFSRKERNKKEYVKRVCSTPDKVKNSFNDGLYLLGDNRKSSMDSRYYGLIDYHLVTGKVCYTLNRMDCLE